ncbi:MAG: DNA-protecting protein DprA [Candidatus Omnitrophica bacterium]|nr:DNA-protecting protein DprA [Candidatus Omnitrophota bacterium]
MSTLFELEALLLLSRTPGIRAAGVRPLFEEGKSPAEVLDWIRSGGNPRWRESLKATEKIFNPGKEIERCENLGIDLIPFTDPRYPALLKESSDPPFVLYVRGELIESDQAAVAIVGSRHPSLYGQEQAKRFAQKLSAWGLTIVSGFARGIDRSAHEGALEISYGRTVAVLGSGLDVIYPREHQALYEEIRERGVLISEFALGTQPFAENFPKRNRIIAGLSLGVLVVEAHSRSGSLITAHLAADEGREVFALPGRVDQLGSGGTHKLIKEGAALVESPEELFEAISSQLWAHVPEEKGNGLEPGETAFLSYFGNRPLSMAQAARISEGPVSKTAALLTRLELKGALRKRFDGRYERVVKTRETSYTQAD